MTEQWRRNRERLVYLTQLYEQVAIGQISRGPHLSAKAFQVFSKLDGMLSREIVFVVLHGNRGDNYEPQLRMKKAIVVGSSSGIGRAVAWTLGQRGYAVGLAGRRAELMAQLQAEIPTPTWVRGVDLSCPAEARRELAALIAEMGGVDLVVINAGLGTPDPNWAEEQDLLRVNVLGFAAAARLAMDYFIGRGSGHLVGVSSVQALRGLTTAYSGSKAFVSTYLEGQHLRAAWLGADVQVTEVRPGIIESAMTAGLPGLFWVVPAEEAARLICAAIESRKRLVYVPRRWQMVAWVLRRVPYRLLAWGGRRFAPALRRPPAVP